ncbi:MAG: peptidase, partial [Pedobacter sp.]
HIYLSMISFAVLLFFAVTGLTLNHPDWFADQQVTELDSGNVNPQWVDQPDTSRIAKLDIVEYLRATHSIKGAVSEFRIDDTECGVSFKGPGYSADAFIKRDDGSYTVSIIKSGIVAVMNDLHKGRDSGQKWAWLIDVSAVLMTIVSLSGIILICFIKKKRINGLLIALGVVFFAILYTSSSFLRQNSTLN